MSIRIENLSKFYGNQKALNNVSFSVNKGEIVGFLGPNGAGKSTLMKILTTYIQSFDGAAFVNGYSVRDEKFQVQKSIGYLPEHNPLYLDMYVREYLQFNAELYNSAGAITIDHKQIESVIEQTGLIAEANKKIDQLSKGYRQRVGLANAILHNPEILILDEPTTGLDPNQLLEIRELIKNFATENDRTVLFSTHIMQEVEAICDRVIIINKGEIVHDKNIGETLSNSNLETLFTELTRE